MKSLQKYIHLCHIQHFKKMLLYRQRHIVVAGGVTAGGELHAPGAQFRGGEAVEQLHCGIGTFTADGIVDKLFSDGGAGISGVGDSFSCGDSTHPEKGALLAAGAEISAQNPAAAGGGFDPVVEPAADGDHCVTPLQPAEGKGVTYRNCGACSSGGRQFGFI